MSRENVEIVRRVFECFNDADISGVEALSSPDIKVVPLRAALEGTAYRGKDAWARFWSDSTESWEELAVEVESLTESGDDCVVAVGRLRGRGRETGADVDTLLGWVLRLDEDNRVVSIITYPRVADALEAAGLSE
jgi:ketosteroid isomerase-like protein